MEAVCEVLIVDDEVLVRQGIKHLLNWESEGFHICGEAANGIEALEMIEKLSPHIVITDIVMPLMDGVEFTSILKSRYPNIEVIVLSSFGEFQYVRSTFQSGVADYILKPKLDAEQLLAILKRIVKKIPSLQHGSLIKDQAMTVEIVLDKLMSGYQIDETMQHIHESFPYRMFTLFGVDLKGTVTGTKAYWTSQVEQAFEQAGVTHVINQLPTDEGSILYLLNINDRDWDQLMPIIRKLVVHSSDHVASMCWTISDPFYNISELNSHMQQNYMKMKAYRFFLPEHTQLIVRNELPKLKSTLEAFNMNQFTDLITKRKFEEALQLLFDYVKISEAFYDQDVFAYKTLLVNIIFNITIMLGKLEVDTKSLEANKYNYFRMINEAQHVSTAVEQLYNFVDEVNRALALSKQAASNPNMTMILNYIQEHYMEPISLTEIANQFHFNPSYLSSYFSAHNSEGFSEYLNRVRVERAAQLLEQGEMSISEISEHVGYSDHSYFTKVFKKINGVSPSQYRKVNRG